MTAGAQIVITSANSATAGLLIPRLRAAGYRTTGLVRKPVPVGTDEIITDWTNNAAAKNALANADYIIHLSGDANAKNKDAYIASNYTTTRLVADNLSQGKCRRIIYLSYANAGTHEKNLYLRYKGEAEGLLRNTGTELVIFRCPVIIDAPGQTSRMDALFVSQKGRAVPAIGTGHQLMRPIYRGDVVNAIIAAITAGAPGVYELSGPEQFTINEFIQLVNSRNATHRAIPIRHIPGWLARLLSHFIPSLSPTFVDLMLDHTASCFCPATFHLFGISPTPLTSLFYPNP